MPGFIRQIFLTICTTTFILALGGAPALAALLTYEGTAQFIATSPDGTLEPNDQFQFSFTYNDAIQDTDPAMNSAVFPGAITAFSLTRDPGNTGSWDPAGGTFTLPTQLNVRGNDTFGFRLAGTGFPDLDGGPFQGVILNFSGGLSLNDTGSDQTVNEVLGGDLPGDLSAFNNPALILAGGGGPARVGPVTAFRAVAPIPIPNTLLLFGTGLAALIGWRARRARNS